MGNLGVCKNCGGMGYVGSQNCSDCNGTGHVCLECATLRSDLATANKHNAELLADIADLKVEMEEERFGDDL